MNCPLLYLKPTTIERAPSGFRSVYISYVVSAFTIRNSSFVSSEIFSSVFVSWKSSGLHCFIVILAPS